MSECGPGSSLEATKSFRPWLAAIVRKYDIEKINDCGCGDQFWVAHMNWRVNRQGYDIQAYDRVIKLDVSKEKTRDADLILCKDVLRHLDNESAQNALKLFAESAPYLVSDSDTMDAVNGSLKPGNRWPGRPIDLQRPPFSIGKPLETVESDEGGKYYGFWSLR